MVLEKTLESPLDCKEIKPVSPKGNQSWIFTGRTDAEAPIVWPPDPKSWLLRKNSDAGKGWRREEKGTTEDKMVGWHYWFNGHEFEQAPGDGEGQGSLACCSPCGGKEQGMTKWLNNNNIILTENMLTYLPKPQVKAWLLDLFNKIGRCLDFKWRLHLDYILFFNEFKIY